MCVAYQGVCVAIPATVRGTCLFPEPPQVVLPDVHTVQQHGSDLGVIEALDETHHRALAAPRLPDQRHRLPWGHAQGEALEHRHVGAAGVAEADVHEGEGAGHLVRGRGLGCVVRVHVDEGLPVHDGEDALHSGLGLPHVAEAHGSLGHAHRCGGTRGRDISAAGCTGVRIGECWDSGSGARVVATEIPPLRPSPLH